MIRILLSASIYATPTVKETQKVKINLEKNATWESIAEIPK